jgi:hypothetical protein
MSGCDAGEYLPWGERVRPNRARTRSYLSDQKNKDNCEGTSTAAQKEIEQTSDLTPQ